MHPASPRQDAAKVAAVHWAVKEEPKVKAGK